MEQALYTGADALVALAQRFPQLYVAPAADAQEAHRRASARGIAPEDANLNHFVTTPDDELREVQTPAGPIEVLFLKNRQDFETFLQIIGHKSQPDPIARTVGAMTYTGIPDWGKVRAAYASYVAGGGTDWPAEFGRLAKQPGAFTAQLIVISHGPYSNIDATSTPYDANEWLRVSREIRLHHECAHVVCRRTMPDDIAPVWDEITADVVGLVCATGHYPAALAAQFLGVTNEGFQAGRLSEYLSEEQATRIDKIAQEVFGALDRIEAQTQERGIGPDQAFDYLLELKRAPLLAY